MVGMSVKVCRSLNSCNRASDSLEKSDNDIYSASMVDNATLIRRELREEPHPSKRGKQYLTRTHFFYLLFLMQFEDDNDLKQG